MTHKECEETLLTRIAEAFAYLADQMLDHTDVLVIGDDLNALLAIDTAVSLELDRDLHTITAKLILSSSLMKSMEQ